MITTNKPDELVRRVAELRARLVDAGHYVSFDNRIDEATAATLLELSPGTLRNWRGKLTGPPFVVLKRPWYPLPGLITWLDSRTT